MVVGMITMRAHRIGAGEQETLVRAADVVMDVAAEVGKGDN
jgi:hypothetical protein